MMGSEVSKNNLLKAPLLKTIEILAKENEGMDKSNI